MKRVSLTFVYSVEAKFLCAQKYFLLPETLGLQKTACFTICLRVRCGAQGGLGLLLSFHNELAWALCFFSNGWASNMI